MPLGLYIHIPFCHGKCPYCDFYSVFPDGKLIDKYVKTVCEQLKKREDYKFDTVYFGGGTPSVMGAESIALILKHANTTINPEITVECNPSDCGDGGFDFGKAAEAGVNRVSFGLQSSVDSERKALGRRASANDVKTAVRRARSAGIDNITLDLMLGIPGQNTDSLKNSIDFCYESGAKHISAYILKIEEGTYFYKKKESLNLPDDDETADLYLRCVDLIEQGGMKQYEISNFSFSGFESKHNLKYWHCEEYLGIGPAAHSFINGKRYYYERNLADYIIEPKAVYDGTGGDFEEYAMLALRLGEGLQDGRVFKRFGFHIPSKIIEKAKKYENNGFAVIKDNSISLTAKGFLVSNSIIGELLA